MIAAAPAGMLQNFGIDFICSPGARIETAALADKGITVGQVLMVFSTCCQNCLNTVIQLVYYRGKLSQIISFMCYIFLECLFVSIKKCDFRGSGARINCKNFKFHFLCPSHYCKRSKIPAAPMPPPMHIVISAYRPPASFR